MYGDMDAFIDMLETRWVRGTEARQSGRSNAGIIKSVKINILDTPDPQSVPMLSRRVRKIQDRSRVESVEIELVDVAMKVHSKTRGQGFLKRLQGESKK